MLTPARTRPRGVLRRNLDASRLRYGRYMPEPRHAEWVEHYWFVGWDLTGEPPLRQETLPHPNVHLVVDPSGSGAFGVQSRRFVCDLAGRGCVFGIKFRPGGFRPFLGRPVSSIANGSVRIGEVFGADGDAYERAVLGCDDVAYCVERATRLLDAHRPAPDAAVARVAAIVAEIAATREITTARRLAAHCGIGLRALQRLFGDYVGASPKWVINRYRLHEAVERLAAGDAVDWADLALELGYFDQAHFNRDFRKLVGRAPGAFARAEGERKVHE